MRILLAAGSNAVIEGFTFTNGQVRDSTWVVGGGVRLHAGELRHCLITKNNAGNNGSAGGIYMTGGLISNCVVRANYGWMQGNGIYMTGGLVRETLIVTNGGGRTDMSGGGVYMTGGTLLNCVIRDNYSGTASGPGGGVYQNGGSILNCTIAHNSAGGNGGGITNLSGGVTNSIIYFNQKLGVANDFQGNPARAAYSCAPELAGSGSGNIGGNPLFTDAGARDYTLQLTSPCLDTGTELPAVTIDFAGQPRPQDGDGNSSTLTDMGALEAPDAGAGPLQIAIGGTPLDGLNSLEVTFTAQPAGANTNLTWYGWDFDLDGNWDLSGAGLGTVTSPPYPPGYHGVALTVSNAAAERASITNLHFIHVAPAVLYVSLLGSHQSPFTNWATAATNLDVARQLALGGTTIRITNGVYGISNTVVLDEAIILSGAGAQATILTPAVASGERRVIQMTDSNAVIEDLTVSNGYTTVFGGAGILMSAGTVRRCAVVKNWTSNNKHGGGIFITGGRVTDSLIQNNIAHLNGGGLYIDGAQAIVSHCRIIGNTSGMNAGYHGGGIQLNAGTVRNCLIVGNTCGSGGVGGGLRVDGGLLESSTIIGNRGGSAGGGVSASSPGTVTNSILYDNTLADGSTNNAGGTLSRYGYCCAPELTHDPLGTGNINGNPLFRLLGTGYGAARTGDDPRLNSGSPCIGAALRLPWMTDAIDLDGNVRVLGGTPDLGAYETLPNPGTLMIFF